MKDQAGPVASEFLAKGVEAGTVVATGSRVLGAGAGALTNWVIGKTFSSMAAEFSVDVEAQLLENVRASRDYASTDDTAAAEILDDLLATPESEAVLQQGFWYRMQLIDTAVHPALTLLVADYATERIGPDNFFRQAGRLLSNLRRAELVALRMVFEQYLDLLQPGLTGAGVYSDRAGGFVGQPGINQQHDTPLMDHGNAIAQIVGRCQVVGDKQKDHIKFFPDIGEQLEQLDGDGCIQHGGGLICHDEVRIQHNGPCHRNPLALATGKLVGIPVIIVLPRG